MVSFVPSSVTTTAIDARGSAQDMRLAFVDPTSLSPAR